MSSPACARHPEIWNLGKNRFEIEKGNSTDASARHPHRIRWRGSARWGHIAEVPDLFAGCLVSIGKAALLMEKSRNLLKPLVDISLRGL
jgi:hypothetical protein